MHCVRVSLGKMAEEGVPVNQWELWALPGCHGEFSAPGTDKQLKEEALQSSFQTDRLTAWRMGVRHCVMLRNYIRRWHKTLWAIQGRGEWEGSRWSGQEWMCKGKGKVDKRRLFVWTVAGQHTCLSMPCAWSALPGLTSHQTPFPTIFLIQGLCIVGTWSCSSCTYTELLDSSTPGNEYVYVYRYLYMYLYVSHNFTCEYSCHSVAFFQVERGEKTAN